MTSALDYTPDADIEMSKIGTIKLLCAEFSSHEDGLPEWVKNSSDEYIRRDASEAHRVIVVILTHGGNVTPSLSCLDFGGMSATALETNFRKWGRDPDAAAQRAEGEQGQHGNGGKCYMVQMFDDYARVVTVSSNKKCVYGVPSGSPRFGYIPSAKEGRDTPVKDVVADLKHLLKDLRSAPEKLGPDIARRVEEATGFTLVTGFAPKGLQDGALSARGIIEILAEHPQMQISLELCRVYVVENGRLVTPTPIVLPKIKPMGGFEEPRRIDLPDALVDPTTGAKVSSTNGGTSSPGFLVLHTSDVSMRYKKRGRHVINYKATSGWIGYDGVLEFDVSSSYRDRLYGYCTLEALEPFKGNKREHLANSPLTRAVKDFITKQIAEYCAVFEKRDKRSYDQKEKSALDEMNKALDKWKNRFLKEMLGSMWGPGTKPPPERLPAGVPSRIEVSLSHRFAGVGICFRPSVKFFDKANKQIRAVPFRWISDDTNVALVDEDLNVVSTFTPGSTIIHAEVLEGKLASNRVALDVVHLRSIRLEPSEIEVPLHGRKSFLAICELDNGTETSDVYLTWAEGNPDVARVSSAGVVFGFGLGNTEVTAMDEHVEALQPAKIRVVEAKAGDGEKGRGDKERGSGFPLVLISEVNRDPETNDHVQFSPDTPPVAQRPQDVDRNVWWVNSAAPFARLFLDEKQGYGYKSPEWRMYLLERYIDIMVQIAMIHGPDGQNPLTASDWIMSWGQRVAEIQSAAAASLHTFVTTGELPSEQ